MLIYYCNNCKVRITAAEIEAHSAVFIDETTVLCAKCAPAQKKMSSRQPSAKPASETALLMRQRASSSALPRAAVDAPPGSPTAASQTGGTGSLGGAGALRESGSRLGAAEPEAAFPANLKLAILVFAAGLPKAR